MTQETSEVMVALRAIQKDLNEQRKLINKTAEELTEKVTENINKIFEEKILILEEKHENIKTRVENQESRIYYLEKHARQRNLVFFGLQEDEKSYHSMEINIIDLINKHLPIKIDCTDLEVVRRIGKKTEKPRPVVVTFATLGKKIGILKNKGALKETPYYVKEDYPPSVLQRRKELQEQVKVEREKGNKAIIKYDKLIILENTAKNSKNKKRSLPNSPENAPNNFSQNIPHVSKKNKTVPALTKQKCLSQPDNIVKPGILNYVTIKNNNNNAIKEYSVAKD